MRLKAIVIGATGLVGSRLVRLLLEDLRFDHIHIFVRQATGLAHPRLTEHRVDFNKIDEWSGQIRGDVLFSALGTTRKKAGSKKNQYQVDFNYQYEVARIAAQNGVPDFVLVSSAGADPESRLFYSRMKGELEKAVQKMKFQRIIILRPSILDGKRKKKRPAEALSLKVMHVVTRYIFRKYRPVRARIVAHAMINSIFIDSLPTGVSLYQPDELFILADR